MRTMLPLAMILLALTIFNPVFAEHKEDECIDSGSVWDIVTEAVEEKCGEEAGQPAVSRLFFGSQTRCTTNADCATGQFCRPFFRICANLRATGQFCVADAQCTSGTCNLTVTGIFFRFGQCA